MEYKKIKKYFYIVTGFWYFTLVSMFYPLILSYFESPQTLLVGRILTAIDVFVMLILFSLFGLVVVNAFKKKDYKIALTSTVLIIIPLIWFLATLDDTFGTYTVSRFI